MSLINDFIDLFLIRKNKFESRKGPTDLRKNINELMFNVTLQAQEKDIKVREEIDKDVPRILGYDKNRLHSILLILMLNAIKFTPVGGSVKLMVKFSKENKKIYLAVKDNGSGISEFSQKKMFNLIGNLNLTEIGGDVKSISNLDENTEGIGLGLYYCRTVLKEMGGSIVFQTEVNKGTIFYIQLPVDVTLLPEFIT